MKIKGFPAFLLGGYMPMHIHETLRYSARPLPGA